VRKQLYDKRKRRKGSTRENTSGTSKREKGRASILGMNNQAVSSPTPEAISTPGSRTSSNSCRRPRRVGVTTPGDVVRSEYEQEQIIAELTAKEAMEKRIAHGGIRTPRQICKLERDLTAIYINTFESQRTLDPLKESQQQSLSNVWTDMEKCIFLDRFLQHPKDFRKIASFLRNKSTKDCVAFYYDSKQSVPYKVALKEHLMRRKRRGDYQNWDATIEASLSCGATILAGNSEDKPLLFRLPADDTTFDTFDLHPIRHKILDRVDASENNYDETVLEEYLTNRSRKRKRDPLFILDEKARKYLKSSVHYSQTKRSNDEPKSKTQARDKFELADQNPATCKIPLKWVVSEKKVFHEIVSEHGPNWSILEETFGAKTPAQIKNYYQDYKKHSERQDIVQKMIDSKATEIDEEIPRKKKNLAAAVPSNISVVKSEVKIPDKPTIPKEQNHQVSRQVRETQRDQIQQMSQIKQPQPPNTADFHQQAMFEIAAHKAAQDQVKLQKEQRVSDHEAVLLLQQQQNRLFEQHAQEEARRLTQLGFSGLSGLSPWAMQLAALQHQQSQQKHQQSSNQQSDSVIFQNAMTLRQRPTGHHGFSLDPAVVRQMRLGQIPCINGNLGNTSLLHVDNTSQHKDAERSLAELRGSNTANTDSLNAFRAAASLSQTTRSPSIAGAIAFLNHVNQGDRGFPQDKHYHDRQPSDRY